MSTNEKKELEQEAITQWQKAARDRRKEEQCSESPQDSPDADNCNKPNVSKN